MNWTNGLEFCKKSDTYLLSNISLSSLTSSCTGFDHGNVRWIGIIKEDFLSTDDGNYIYSETYFIKPKIHC